VKEAMAEPGRQFLLVGDTWHKDDDLEKFLRSPALAALFNYAAIPHVAWEVAREDVPQERLDAFREACGLYRQGRLNDDQLAGARREFFANGLEDQRKYIDRSLTGFMQAGLRTTPADSLQWRDGTPDNAERVFLGDREVSSYIGARARGEKTAVVYGAAHFYYNDSMGTRFGRDRCVHLDIYPSRAVYENFRTRHRMYVDHMPDKVYLVAERALENPDPSIYFSACERENDEAQEWRDDIARIYGENAEVWTKANALMNRVRQMPGMQEWFDFIPG
jgi:hypothetical protein